jgi:hypothetical protein
MSGTGSSQDTPFVAMEYLDGQRLEKNIVRLTRDFQVSAAVQA